MGHLVRLGDVVEVQCVKGRQEREVELVHHPRWHLACRPCCRCGKRRFPSTWGQMSTLASTGPGPCSRVTGRADIAATALSRTPTVLPISARTRTGTRIYALELVGYAALAALLVPTALELMESISGCFFREYVYRVLCRP